VRPTEALGLWGEVRIKGGSFDSGPRGREPLDGFAIVNLSADYRLLEELMLRARIENLFDTEYEEVLGFGTAGLSAYFGAAVTLAR
jgi:vitamin B12 transporter